MSRRIPEEDDEEYKLDTYMICSYFNSCVFTWSCASLWLHGAYGTPVIGISAIPRAGRAKYCAYYW